MHEIRKSSYAYELQNRMCCRVWIFFRIFFIMGIHNTEMMQCSYTQISSRQPHCNCSRPAKWH